MSTTLRAVQNEALIPEGFRDKLQKYQDEYDLQLAAFKNLDESKEYSSLTPRNGFMIARLFLFDVKRDSVNSGAKNVADVGKILISKNTLAKDSSILNHVVPVVKVIKASENEYGIKTGDVWTVPPYDVMGKRMNKEFAAIMQMNAFSSDGQQLPTTVPKEVQESISALSQNWGGSLLLRPWMVTPEPKDFLTFVLPKSKFMCKWDYDQF